MVRVTLNNLVLKTERVGNVMPAALADRIGSGFGVSQIHPPATFLSLGQIPMPWLSEPDEVSGQVVSDVKSKPPARKPVGTTGSDSGATAGHVPQTSTPRTTASGWRLVRAYRASYPGFRVCTSRIDRDCQSPDRPPHTTNRNANALRRRHRTANPAPTAAN